MGEAMTLEGDAETKEAANDTPKKQAAKKPQRSAVAFLRGWLRAFHRDIGYLAVGLTLVYAISGLAVNHIADWAGGDPNFQKYETTHEFGPLAGDDDAIAKTVGAKLGIKDAPREVFRRGPDELDIAYDHRDLHVDTKTGHVIDEGSKPRFFLRVANWLHLNRGKKAWTYFADAYAVGLLFLACSGLFMIPGRKGLIGRGAVLVALGAAIPIVYVTLSGP
jgi:hypothetical protein